jgi:hypothetical protein
MRISLMVKLKHPCPKCGQIWATVTGTTRKRERVKCYTQGHLLTGSDAATDMTYKKIVQKVRNPNRMMGVQS